MAPFPPTPPITDILVDQEDNEVDEVEAHKEWTSPPRANPSTLLEMQHTAATSILQRANGDDLDLEEDMVGVAQEGEEGRGVIPLSDHVEGPKRRRPATTTTTTTTKNKNTVGGTGKVQNKRKNQNKHT